MTRFPIIKKYVEYLRARPGVSFYEYLLGEAHGKGPAPGSAINLPRGPGWRALSAEEADRIRETGEWPEDAWDVFLPATADERAAARRLIDEVNRES